MLIEIYRFFCSFVIHDPVFWYIFQTAWNRSSNYWNIAKVTFCNLFLITWWTFDNLKHLTIYIRRKEIPLFIQYTEFYVLGWTYMFPRLLLIWLNVLCCFFILPLCRYTLFRKHQFLKNFLWRYFLACLMHFLCVRVIFC